MWINLKKLAIRIFFTSIWNGWRRWLLLMINAVIVILLGVVRVKTDTEFFFASLAIFPVLFTGWMNGKNHGFALAFLTSVMWVESDIATNQHFSASWIPWANLLTNLAVYFMLVLMVVKLRQKLDRERELATHDVLTGIQNRRAFIEAGISEVERSKRYKHSLTVFYVDLDNFKKLNDTKGHDTGDAALKAAAHALHNSMRVSDRAARLGGDEFAALLPEIGYDATIEAVNKIFDAMNTALKEFAPVKASMGVAWFGEVEREFPDMLKAADELMYEVKSSGKGKILVKKVTSSANNEAVGSK